MSLFPPRSVGLKTLWCAGMLAAWAGHGWPRPVAAEAPARPNIVFILVDDLRWDEAHYPFVRAPHIQRIAREGVRFGNAFVTTPLCSPSRASFLTGQYARRHGITDNTDRSARSHALATFPRLLHDAGYETAFVGKWHMGLDDTPRPGMDHWVSVSGQGRYLDPEFNVNGRRERVSGYFTDILNRHAVDFLERKHAKPFLLYVSHKAVHPDLDQRADGSLSDPGAGRFLPAERHQALYAASKMPRRPNHGRPPAGKPALLRRIGRLPPLGPQTVTDDETIRNRLRMLAPGAEGMDGRSLAPLLRGGQVPWRKSVVIEYFSDTVFPRVLQMGYQAVRTKRWKYIRYRELDGMDELYDLRSDPFEMRNVIAAPHARSALKESQAELTKLLDTL